MYLVVQELGRVVSELAENLGADLLRGEVLACIGAFDLHLPVGALCQPVRHLQDYTATADMHAKRLLLMMRHTARL